MSVLKPLPPITEDAAKNIKRSIEIRNNEFPDETHAFTKGPGSSNRTLECPLSVMADSYKGTHILMYPETAEMRVYGTFRQKFKKEDVDDRIVVYGIKHYINQFISRTIEDEDIAAGRKFIAQHLIPPIIHHTPRCTNLHRHSYRRK